VTVPFQRLPALAVAFVADAAGVLCAALSSIVDKPSLYLVRAAQATT
jgi:hypothetical protein